QRAVGADHDARAKGVLAPLVVFDNDPLDATVAVREPLEGHPFDGGDVRLSARVLEEHVVEDLAGNDVGRSGRSVSVSVALPDVAVAVARCRIRRNEGQMQPVSPKVVEDLTLDPGEAVAERGRLEPELSHDVDAAAAHGVSARLVTREP